MSRACLWLGIFSLSCTSVESEDDRKKTVDSAPAPDSAEPSDSGQGDDTGWSCEEGSAHVEVGTGEDSFVPLAVGDPVIMVYGPQGGWHILGGVRIWSMEPIVDIHFQVMSVEHSVFVADNVYRVATVIETQCTSLFWGMYGYLDVREISEGELDTPPELLAYEDVEVRMTITDRTGAEAFSSVVVKAIPDPVNLEDEESPEH